MPERPIRIRIMIWANELKQRTMYCRLLTKGGHYTGKISKDKHDKWRYNSPLFDDTMIWKKIPSLEFSDTMIKTFKSNTEW
jgi:hypothetical protein